MEGYRERAEQLVEECEPVRAQVCIVGAGLAGISLAHRLVQQGVDVVLLEAGSEAPAEVPAVEMLGRPHPGTCEERPRTFGGTSLRWGGQLLPPTADDLVGWPIGLEEISPYLEQAERLLGVDATPYESPAWFKNLGMEPPALLRGLTGANVRLSKWTAFGKRNLAKSVGRALRKSDTVRTFLGVEATRIVCAKDGSRVEAVLAHDALGRPLRFEAAQFVIAAGTLDTVGLLLTSGIDALHGGIGCNIHDHLTLTAADLLGEIRKRVLQAMRPWWRGSTMRSFKLEATKALREELGLLPVLAHITIEEEPQSSVALLRSVLADRQKGSGDPDWRRTIATLPAMGFGGLRLLWEAKVLRRRYVSSKARVRVQLNCAQETPSTSRITLANDGQLQLDWRIAERETHTLRMFARFLRRRSERAGQTGVSWNSSLFGDLSSGSDLTATLDDARHLMGGACMGTDPATSVVDGSLSMHGLPNLSIASAAVFPTGAPQLPGLLLIALSLRLADRLAAETTAQ